MTRELLEQYPFICTEIDRLEITVSDVVVSSSAEYPYMQHAQKIQGMPISDLDLLGKLKSQKTEIESFVRNLPNSELREIVRLKAFQGLSFCEVAGQISKTSGRGYSEGQIKQKYYRILK